MDTILVLCQGRRQSALIARTLRYRQVYSLPLALDSPAETVLSYAPKGIVLSAPDGAQDVLARLDPGRGADTCVGRYGVGAVPPLRWGRLAGRLSARRGDAGA